MDVSTGQFAPQVTGLIAGEDLAVAAPCYIKSSDGKVYMSNATSANEAAEVVGFTPRAAKSGEPVTLFGIGARFHYGAALTPGNILYVGATAGRLDTAATTGDAFGVAEVLTATDIRVISGNPRLVSATVGAGTITSTELASNAVTTAKITDANVTAAKLEAGGASAGLLGTQVRFAADANVIGAIPVLHRVDVADGVTGDVDVTLTHKTRVVDVWLVKTAGAGGASDTITVKNGATAITDAMDINVADKTVVRAGTIDDAQHEIAAAGTLRVTRTKVAAANVACVVYVLGVRVA
jgi:hypothetical protein